MSELIAHLVRPPGDPERMAAALLLAHRVKDVSDHSTNPEAYVIGGDGWQATYDACQLESSFGSDLYRLTLTLGTDLPALLIDYLFDLPGAPEGGEYGEDVDREWQAQIEEHLAQLTSEGEAWTGPTDGVLEDLYNRRSKLIADVLPRADRPVPQWLIQGVMVAGGDDYGVLAAEAKAGKTWLALDLAVAVASGQPWLGLYPTTKTTVLLYSSEGGPHTIGRRVQAIAEHYGVDAADLPIHLVTDAPDLTTDTGVRRFTSDIRCAQPGLIIIDPLYRASRNVNSASLNEVGGVLGAAQEAAQAAQAALLVVAHWNQTGTGNGAKRISGAGPWEWARVLLSMHATGGDDVAGGPDGITTAVATLAVEISGGNRPPQALLLERTIASNLMDLSTPIRYTVGVSDEATDSDEATGSDMAAKVLRAIQEEPGLARVALYRPGRLRVGSKDAVSMAVRELLDEAKIEERTTRAVGSHRSVNGLYLAQPEAEEPATNSATNDSEAEEFVAEPATNSIASGRPVA